MKRFIYHGETFTGLHGYSIGERIYFSSPLEAIKEHCKDETNNTNINAYDWYLVNDDWSETLIYKGDKACTK